MYIVNFELCRELLVELVDGQYYYCECVYSVIFNINRLANKYKLHVQNYFMRLRKIVHQFVSNVRTRIKWFCTAHFLKTVHSATCSLWDRYIWFSLKEWTLKELNRFYQTSCTWNLYQGIYITFTPLVGFDEYTNVYT